MIKRIVLLLSFLVLTVSVIASPVDPQRAIQVAHNFLLRSSSVKRAPMKGVKAEPTSTIVYTQMMPNSDRPAFYIVNDTDESFVLVSANDVAHPVLGYSLTSKWPVSDDGSIVLPVQIKGYFDDLAAQMEFAIDSNPNMAPDAEWTSSGSIIRSPLSGNIPDSIGPLLTTSWDQGQYYNASCPEDVNGYDGHALTGCVATAMAQIIKYWGDQTQIRTRGVHIYETNYGKLTVDFNNVSYDFNNMPSSLTSESTPNQVDAISTLIYHCGVAANTNYGSTESSSFDVDARAGLINFYRFSPNMSYAEKNQFTNTEWNNLLRENIATNHPIIYSGYNEASGHTFVLDGYNANDYFHFNFGWGGFADGWYLTNAVSPDNMSFNSSQTAIVGIMPYDIGNIIIGQKMGLSIFQVNEPLEFYDLMGHNSYEVNSLYSCDNTVVFIPVDETKQVVADIMEYKGLDVRIYNGLLSDPYKDDLLRRLQQGNANNDITPVVSTTNAITIKYSGNQRYGFKICLSQETNIRMVSNIVFSIDGTSVNLTWRENGSATKWQIEYGESGFEIGTGTVYYANNTSAVFKNLEKFKDYDFYIRSVGNDNQYGLWNKISLVIAPYWTDVVQSEPTGFSLDANGEIHVSTSEGLAWIAKRLNYYGNAEDGFGWFSDRNIIIEQDIDLSGYLWEPIEFWFGNIYGNGHVISNMRSISVEYYDMGGLFGTLYGDTIMDLGFCNSYIEGYNAATIAGHTENLIGDKREEVLVINCYSVNYSSCPREYGTSSGLINGGNLVNCYSVGKLVGKMTDANTSRGGLASLTAYNCYTSVTEMIALGWRGLFADRSRGASYYNCFADIDYIKDDWSSNNLGILYDDETVGYFINIPEQTSFYNVAGFTRKDGTLAHTVPETSINYHYEGSLDLVTALNGWLFEMNSPHLRTWIWDSISGLPVFGDYFVPKYPSVSNLNARNITCNDGYAVALSWKENGNAKEWQIKYHIKDSLENSIVVTQKHVTGDTIMGLQLGNEYSFYVRPFYDENDSVGWGEPISVFVDKPYWTDVVLSCPSGYREESNGTITISSAEGLAWLSVCSNGLNGQQQNNYEGKQIIIISDIDLGGYRWLPICQWRNGSYIKFMGSLNGNGHVVSNLYCNGRMNSNNEEIGLIGCAENAKIQNIRINTCDITGYSAVGALVGDVSEKTIINNCHVYNVIIKGVKWVGGLIGQVNTNGATDGAPIIYNCSSSGVVYGDQGVGGFAGIFYGFNELIGKAYNCYTTANVSSLGVLENGARGGFVGTINSFDLRNCYSTGEIDYIENNPMGVCMGVSFASIGSISRVNNVYAKHTLKDYPFYSDDYYFDQTVGSIKDTTFFNTEGVLDKSIKIGDNTCFDLLNALNTWVDLNNTTGNYVYWTEDTANMNGGYPILKEELETSVQTILSPVSKKMPQKVYEQGKIYFILPNGIRFTPAGIKVE